MHSLHRMFCFLSHLLPYGVHFAPRERFAWATTVHPQMHGTRLIRSYEPRSEYKMCYEALLVEQQIEQKLLICCHHHAVSFPGLYMKCPKALSNFGQDIVRWGQLYE